MTTLSSNVIFVHMKVELMLDERHVVSETAFVEIVVWRVQPPVSGSHHAFKYRLVLVVDGECVLRYDNETGKGDHKHMGKNELPYIFTTSQNLLDDFWHDVENWRP
ncbi:MAG: DUF6516 family protein [Desulfatiglandaceae bacterium]